MKNRRLSTIFFSFTFCLAALIGCKSNKIDIESFSAYSEMSLKELNNKIDKSQKRALHDSPFTESSGHVNTRIKIQKPHRKYYIEELKDILSRNLTDTIFLVETYSEECFNCLAHTVNIYKDSILIDYKYSHGNKLIYKRCQRTNNFDSSLYIQQEDSAAIVIGYDDVDDCAPWNLGEDIIELKTDIAQKGSTWNANPEIYGTEEILGGGYTLYSIFFPDGRIESMYQRAWLPAWYRKNSKK